MAVIIENVENLTINIVTTEDRSSDAVKRIKARFEEIKSEILEDKIPRIDRALAAAENRDIRNIWEIYRSRVKRDKDG